MAKKTAAKKDQVKIVAQAHNFAGKYRLAANYGQTISVDKDQADEIIKAKDGMELSIWEASQKKAKEADKTPEAPEV